MVAQGQWLASQSAVHAIIDTSDGLVQDAGHIANESGLGLDIDSALVPISPALGRYCRSFDVDPFEFALGRGEDYQLAVAVSAGLVGRVVDRYRRKFGTVITPIGRFTSGDMKVRVDGRLVGKLGFRHFG